MRIYDILLKKRNGGELTPAEIRFFVNGYTAGDIPDYQASALMMAIFFRGMNERETVDLTAAMAASGDAVDLSRFGNLSVDKHSTGGVGDKTSLIVGPIVAALGGKVTKMSGRGLGHTGGTVDKLESIPGFRTSLSADAFLRQVETVGIAIIGQSGNLAPADKKLYALRDVTATVDSIPLITSSIMSKKLAAGSKNIVLDVKVGSGAFMKTPAEAETLAREMVKIGKACGRNMAALLTDMNAPLGHAIGNALEVQEAAAVLKNECGGDLREVSLALAAEMTALFQAVSVEEAKRLVTKTLESGAAYRKMREWIAAQGGDVAYLDNPTRFPTAHFAETVPAPRDGYLVSMNAQAIGTVSVLLGAGRAKKDDAIDPAAGILLHKKPGDRVRAGEPLCTLYTSKSAALSDAAAAFVAAVTIGDNPPLKASPILGVIR